MYVMLNPANWPSLLWKNVWLVHSARTAVGATASLTVARLLGMPEPYWAAIATLTVMQSTLGAAWPISKQRFIGTALGAALGGFLASYFDPGIIAFFVAIFVLGLICAILHLDQSAYRFAGITLAIVMLVVRGATTPQLIAVHRFVEVSLGIAVALALTALWPEHELTSD
jgi:uncharacterized membrane protein YccC